MALALFMARAISSFESKKVGLFLVGLFLPNLSVFIGADDGLCGKLFVIL